MMKNIFSIMVLAGLALAACSNNTEHKHADSSATSIVNEDTTAVKEADSTHSFRNDRGTDSVSAGKSVPRKP